MYAIIKPGYPTALVDGVVVTLKTTPTAHSVPIELLLRLGFSVRHNAHEMQIEIQREDTCSCAGEGTVCHTGQTKT